MGRLLKNLKPRDKIAAAVNGLLLLLLLGAVLLSGYLVNLLESQGLARRWSADGTAYGQVSVFLPEYAGLTEADIWAAASGFDQKLEEASMEAVSENPDALLWTYGYSAERMLYVTWQGKGAEAAATGAGGNFFLFHPLPLLSGAYFYGSDLMQDRVVIDDTLAWQLFGATDVAGMEIEIGGLPYLIAGVVKPEGDFASKAAYGDRPRIYMSYSALLKNDPAAVITCCEVLLPNPVANFAKDVTGSVLEGIGVAENRCAIVENSARYSLTGRLGVLGEFGLRSMRQVGLTYPYWENAARIMEDYAALLLVLTLLLSLFPAVSLIRLLVLLWRNRKWRLRTMRAEIDSRLEARRERKRSAEY